MRIREEEGEEVGEEVGERGVIEEIEEEGMENSFREGIKILTSKIKIKESKRMRKIFLL